MGQRNQRYQWAQRATAPKKAKKAKKPKGNAPALDLKAELKRICGVDLTSIDGIDVMTAQTILSEVGGRKVQNRVAMSLRMAASTLLNSKSYLGGRYRHLRQELPGKAAAVKAMARYLAVLVYRMLTKGQAWVDRGATRFEQKRAQRELASWQWKALAKGFKLTPIGEAK